MSSHTELSPVESTLSNALNQQSQLLIARVL